MSTAWSVNHQSQYRVPPTPWTALAAVSPASGNFRPELTSAVVLPAPGGPMTRDDAPDDRTGDNQQNQGDDDEARNDALERLRIADGDERPGEPDYGCENQRADNAERDPKPA